MRDEGFGEVMAQDLSRKSCEFVKFSERVGVERRVQLAVICTFN